MNIAIEERPQVKAECLRLLLTLKLDPALMQMISGFFDVYLNLNEQENQAFKTAVDRMRLTDEEEEKYMEIVTSWKREGIEEATERIAINLLREGSTVEFMTKVTGLTTEKVQELQAQLKREN